MSQHQQFANLEKEYQKKKVSHFSVGDTVRVHTRIIEGQKERIQTFTGIVIGKRGGGLSETFSVYRNAYGCSMEKVFLLHSPRVEIEVDRYGKVKKAKLNYLKGATGKKAKVREKIMKKGSKAAKAKKEIVSEEIVAEEPLVETIETPEEIVEDIKAPINEETANQMPHEEEKNKEQE